MECHNRKDIKKINDHQQRLYENYEKKSIENYLDKFSVVLEFYKAKQEINILDIGGASGYFAMGLYKYFNEKNCKIVVFDSTKYDTWSAFSDKIDFVESSVDNLGKYFLDETFDIVFANRVFHHFVRNTWKETIGGINKVIGTIYSKLKKDGYFCILDHFYNGFMFDKITSKIVYSLTSCNISVIKYICKKFGAESAGVGVCFLSKKMWKNILAKNDFKIKNLIENKKELKLKMHKKILLCARKINLDNVIICERQNI
jgi:SAM-dependent methyltransferase